MFSSLKSKMLVPIIGVLVLMMVVIVAYVSLSVQTLVGDLTYERVAVASGAARARLDDFEIRTQITASAVAGSYGVTSALVNWNANNNRPQVRQNLIAYLTPMAADLGVDSFVIRDVEGRMVLRLHDLGSYNDFDGKPGKEERELITSEVMAQIAKLLPEQMRGIYSEQAQSEEYKYLDFI